MAFGPPKAIKNGSDPATTLPGSAALPFVISTGAQRSGEICGVSGPSLGMFFDSDKNGFYSATILPGSAALPFVISTGAPKERSGEICGVSGPSLGMFFDRAQRSGEICGVSGPSLGMFFDRSETQWRDLRFHRSLFENVFRQSICRVGPAVSPGTHTH